MSKDTEVIMTVEEWAKQSGLTLHNYDGFVDIYEQLKENIIKIYLKIY